MANSKKPTTILSDEHREVLEKLDTLEDLLSRTTKKKEIEAPLRELAHFFKTSFWTHFAKEEEALFTEFGKYVPLSGEPIEVMLEEHEYLRDIGAQFQEAVKGYLAGIGEPEANNELREYGARFLATLRDHISKEDNRVFPMIAARFEKANNRSVLDLFKKIDSGFSYTYWIEEDEPTDPAVEVAQTRGNSQAGTGKLSPQSCSRHHQFP